MITITFEYEKDDIYKGSTIEIPEGSEQWYIDRIIAKLKQRTEEYNRKI